MRLLRFLAVGLVAGMAVLACAPSEVPVGDGTAGAAAGNAPTLSSWNEGPARAAIEGFVARVTDPTSPDFVPVAERIAVFDNDGTLWAEQPAYFQLLFGFDLMRQRAEADPDLAAQEPYRTLLADGPSGLAGMDVHELLGAVAQAHAGMTQAEFTVRARDWLATARHPERDRLYTEMVYAPMLELLAYLRAHEFQTWIVSGGGIDMIRAFSEDVYGIPPEQVVGSQLELAYEMTDDGPVIRRQPEIAFVDDGPGKPVGISRHIGRRPILAAGNSDGDLQMLQYTASGAGPSLALLVHHDDAAREWAYDRDSSVGRLDAALGEAESRGWTVISMRNDWTRVFPE